MLKQQDKYKQEQHKYRHEKRKKFFDTIAHKLGLHFHWYKDSQIQKILDQNLAPDVSTVNQKIAIVIGDEVVEVMFCQEKMASILLSKPKFIDVTNSPMVIKTGFKYKNNKFYSN